ncbi:hypothetical protein [Streptomyces chrestomyceticus]|nr:hypothetical protein [Streptomyces chrestomyceticus]
MDEPAPRTESADATLQRRAEQLRHLDELAGGALPDLSDQEAMAGAWS